MAKLKKKKVVKKIRKVRLLKPVKRRKNLIIKKTQKKKRIKKVHPAKFRKAKILPKVKLFNRVKRIIKLKKRVAVRLKKKSVEKAVSRKIRKHISKTPAEGFPAESLFKAKIKVIGIGGGGGSIVSEIGRSLEKATFVIADTDIRALKKKTGIKYFWFGEDLTHGLGTGVNVDLAKQAALAAKEKLSSFFKEQDIIIFIASLGGGLGSGATQVFAEAAREFGGITFGIFTMPFKFEGKNKHHIAQNALKSLRKSLNVSLVIPNEKIFKIIDSSTPITNAFSTVNKSLIESLESLIDLIYNPGIINIDFADLRTILKGRGNSAFLNTIEESGKDRVEKICEKIFKNPLLQNNSFKAEKILFNIAGSENLSMFEVEKISSHIAGLNPKAKIIFGISKNAKLKNKIKTTILMTGVPPGSQIEENIVIEEFKPERIIVKEPIVKLINHQKKSGGKKNKKSSMAVPTKKPIKKEKSAGIQEVPRGEKPVSFIPVFEIPEPAGYPSVPVVEQNKMDIVQTPLDSIKNLPVGRHGTIRRSGLEIKKAEELEEKKKIAQEKEWEVPAFLRKIKFKS